MRESERGAQQQLLLVAVATLGKRVKELQTAIEMADCFLIGGAADGVFAGLFMVILFGIVVENVVFRNIELRTVNRWGMQR